jgi:hypothetical protein
VIICKNWANNNAVEHRLTLGKFLPTLLDQNNPSVGLSNARFIKNETFLLCSFDREKSMPATERYYDLTNQSYYVLASMGPLTQNGGAFTLSFFLIQNKI